jgi:hypothetical protein
MLDATKLGEESPSLILYYGTLYMAYARAMAWLAEQSHKS